MTVPTAPTIIIPSRQSLIWGRELAATGTAAVGGYREGCNSIATTLQRETYEPAEYVGAPTEIVGLEETTKYAQIAVTVPWRANGLAAHSFAALMGIGGEPAPATATIPYYVHTFVPSPVTTRMLTFTLWHDTGVGTNGTMQMTWATLNQMVINYAPNGALSCDLTFWAQAPSITGEPTSTNLTYIGGDVNYTDTRTMGYQGTFNVFNNAGTRYPNRVLGGSITIARQLEALTSSESQTVVDIAPGPLTMVGSLDFAYDGLATGTIYRDYLDFNALGTNGTPNSIKFTDRDGQYLQVQSYPWKWTNYTLNPQGQILRGSAEFRAYNDIALINSATPALSVIQSLTVKNRLASAMVV